MTCSEGTTAIFAFANAGVTLGGDIGAVKLGLSDLPAAVTWKQILGVGALDGVGLTMALFVAQLAFVDVAQALALVLG